MNRGSRVPCQSQAGFTLIEALVAVVVLAFGLIAITNLMLVAASSNSVANHGTAAAAIATRELERLKSLSFVDDCLDAGGDLESNVGSGVTTSAGGACNAGVYWTQEDVSGVGMIRVRWLIEDLVPSRGANQALPAGVKYIIVRAEGLGALTGARSRAEFTTFRTENPDPAAVVAP